jgi:hypothetical protein
MLAAMAFALPLAHEDNTVEKRQGIQTYHNYVTLKGTADAADETEG